VPREDGTMVPRTPTVKPEIQAAIVLHHHDQDRDSKLQEVMLSRVPNYVPVHVAERQTMFVTRKGRKQVASIIHDRLPFLIDGADNVTKRVFDFFPRVDQAPEGGLDFEWTATVSQGVQDPTAQSMKFDVIHHISTLVAAKWARELGASLLSEARKRGVHEKVTDLSRKEGLYICHADTAYQWYTPRFIAPGQGGLAVYLESPVGSIYIRDYVTEHREIHDKWTIHSTVTGTILIDWDKIKVYDVGVEEYDLEVEIVN